MKLFLCSHFSSVGSLIKEEIENKKVAFIPTASLHEVVRFTVTQYVSSMTVRNICLNFGKVNTV